jgi:hypothetical protein
MLHAWKEWRKAIWATCLGVAMALAGVTPERIVAQSWTPPFNHNEKHPAVTGYGDYSHPYSPWNSVSYPVSYPTPAGTPIVDPPIFLGGWPQPATAGGPNFNAVPVCQTAGARTRTP